MGQAAAKVAKQVMREELSKPETLARLRLNPKSTLDAAFATAHKAIESHFAQSYESQGWIVTRAPEGYLLRSKPGSSGNPLCVHGGTTATVLIVLDGRRLVVSNVGDSTAIIAGLGIAGMLRPIEEWVPSSAGSPIKVDLPPSQISPATGGAGATAAMLPPIPALPVACNAVAGAPPTSTCLYSPPQPLKSKSYNPVPSEVSSSYMELSADHSPESHTEFARMHAYRPCPSGTPNKPELLFVYDTFTASKLQCPPIFDFPASSSASDPASSGSSPVKTERGSYYKNVRCEWATLVATPPHAPFQDALAFTRSLGDLHLQTYGVSHTPESWWMDLLTPLESSSSSSASSSSSEGRPLVSHPTAIVLASDGLWDNWKFEEVAAFALTPDRVAKVHSTGSALGPAAELMDENIRRGHANFGNSADNMSALVLYIFPGEG
jgi:serine/threonine protein phosphatase PrpC